MSGDPLDLDALVEWAANERPETTDAVNALAAEVRRLRAQVEAARGFHSSDMLGHCQEDCCGETFPCRTLAALDAP